MSDSLLPELAKSIAQQGLLFAVLAAIIVTGLRKVWVPGFAYDEKKTERDQATAALDRFVGIHEDQARLMEENTELLRDVVTRLERLERHGPHTRDRERG